jgi:hypothetical protein
VRVFLSGNPKQSPGLGISLPSIMQLHGARPRNSHSSVFDLFVFFSVTFPLPQKTPKATRKLHDGPGFLIFRGVTEISWTTFRQHLFKEFCGCQPDLETRFFVDFRALRGEIFCIKVPRFSFRITD